MKYRPDLTLKLEKYMWQREAEAHEPYNHKIATLHLPCGDIPITEKRWTTRHHSRVWKCTVIECGCGKLIEFVVDKATHYDCQVHSQSCRCGRTLTYSEALFIATHRSTS